MRPDEIEKYPIIAKNIIQSTAIPVGPNSASQKLIKEILSVDLVNVDRQLSTQPIRPHKNFHNGKEIFNVMSRKVLIRDNNGVDIEIDNSDEIQKHKRKYAKEHNRGVEPAIQIIPLNQANRIGVDNDIEFE